MEFLRAIMNGNKKYFTNAQVKRVKVPKFKELTQAKVFDYIKGKPNIVCYLPFIRCDGEPTVDRDFMFSILNTIEPDYFPR